MSVIHHAYSAEKINSFKGILLGKSQKGKPVDYEIRVDGLAVVSRTNDPAQFDEYKKYVIDSTNTINVILYEGQSRNNTNHMFVKYKEVKQQWQPYMDLSPEQAKDMIIAHEKRQWENDELKRENERLRKKLEDAEDEQEESEETITKLEQKIINRHKNWGHIASYALEGAIRRGIPFIAKIPGAEGLMKFLEDNDLVSESGEKTYFVSDKLRKKARQENRSAAQESPEAISTAQILDKEFSKDKMSAISGILLSLAKRPEAIEEAQAFLSKSAGTEKNGDNMKTILKKAKSIYDSIIRWVKYKYKLAAFGLRNIKHLKRML
jgi:hypothetical protein